MDTCVASGGAYRASNDGEEMLGVVRFGLLAGGFLLVVQILRFRKCVQHRPKVGLTVADTPTIHSCLASFDVSFPTK